MKMLLAISGSARKSSSNLLLIEATREISKDVFVTDVSSMEFSGKPTALITAETQLVVSSVKSKVVGDQVGRGRIVDGETETQIRGLPRALSDIAAEQIPDPDRFLKPPDFRNL